MIWSNISCWTIHSIPTDVSSMSTSHKTCLFWISKNDRDIDRSPYLIPITQKHVCFLMYVQLRIKEKILTACLHICLTICLFACLSPNDDINALHPKIFQVSPSFRESLDPSMERKPDGGSATCCGTSHLHIRQVYIIVITTFIFFFVPGGIDVESCGWERLEVACEPNQMMVVSEAIYGRMQMGRCIRKEFGYMGCKSDVLMQMHS